MDQTITILGGDQRQIHLARFLLSDGWNTITWGLENGGAPSGVPLDQALGAGIIILPLPVCRGDGINLPLTDSKLSCEDLWKRLRPGQIILGGMINTLPPHLKHQSEPELLDYYTLEEVQIANAVPTAEGAVMRAMEASGGTLLGSRCLVIGYGRIGKVLAHRLQGMQANVSVSARKRSDLAWIEAFGFHALHTAELAESIGSFDFIFNTVPATVLDADLLHSVSSSCLLVELASPPGGFDPVTAERYRLRVITERGLPGKTAPISAARAIRSGIYHILEEKGVLS